MPYKTHPTFAIRGPFCLPPTFREEPILRTRSVCEGECLNGNSVKKHFKDRYSRESRPRSRFGLVGTAERVLFVAWTSSPCNFRKAHGLEAHANIYNAETKIDMMKKLFAEFFGTFSLVFAGTGAIIINDVSNGSITHLGIALTFGLVVLAMIYAVGDVSGAHFNPAVTIAFFVARRFSGREVIPYIVSQLAGAVAASILLRTLFPEHATLGATLPAGSDWQSFVFEFVLTAILMLVILSVSTGSKERGITAGIVVGAVIAFEALFAGPISGASMNPVRSIAPAIVSLHVSSLWIYVVAPICGALFAVWGCTCMRENCCCVPPANTTAT